MATDDVRPAAPSGAIHDIGYRPYIGVRQDRARVFLTLFAYGLRGAYGLGRSGRSKVAPILLLLAATMPAIIVIVVASVTGGIVDVGYATYLSGIQLLVAIWVAVLSPYVISRDLRHRLTTLYFSRPLERLHYVLARYASASAAILAFMALPLLLLFLGALLNKQPVGDELPDLLRAGAVALLDALLLGAIGLAVAVLAPRRGMGVAAIIAVLLVLGAVAAVLGDVMDASGHDAAQLYVSMIAPMALVDAMAAGLLGVSADGPSPDGALERLAFVGAYAAWLGACAGVLVLRFRKESVL